MRIRIRAGGETLDAELFDTPSGRAVAEVLPFETAFQTWGAEFYFSIPMHPLPLEEDAGVDMQVGDLAYWPEGHSLAIFFGPTPASSGGDPVACGPVNRIGRILGDATVLRRAAGAATIRIEPS